MPKGVKIEEIVVGTGTVAERGMTVVANVRIFLKRGEEVTAEYPKVPRTVVDLSKRETIAGLRYGIEGMRVGGRRKLVISPHLAYGAQGMGEYIPPNAVLTCDVELLEIRIAGVRNTNDIPPGKRLDIFSPGEAAKSIPRCQFGFHEDGGCVAFITSPVPGYGWRPARTRPVAVKPDRSQILEMLREALAMPEQHPAECIPHEALWSDSSEAGNGITRDQATDTRCITIAVYEGDEPQCYYSMRHNSPAWLDSTMRRTISSLIKPDLVHSW